MNFLREISKHFKLLGRVRYQKSTLVFKLLYYFPNEKQQGTDNARTTPSQAHLSTPFSPPWPIRQGVALHSACMRKKSQMDSGLREKNELFKSKDELQGNLTAYCRPYRINQLEGLK